MPDLAPANILRIIAYTDFLNKFSDAKMAEVARQRVAILKADLEKPDADAQ